MQHPWVCEIVEHPDGFLYPVLRDKEHFKTWCRTSFKKGDKVWMIVKYPAKEPSHEQWKYLYSCVYPYIAEELGCTVQEADGVMKRRHLTIYEGTPLEQQRDKSALNRAELSAFIDAVRRDAALMGIETMDPVRKENDG